MLSVELEALETTEMLPVTALSELGAKITAKVKLCPGGKVSGKFKPVTVNVESVMLASVMLTLEAPEFVSVSDRVALLPTCTLPKLRLGEDGCSALGGVVPAPKSGMESAPL
jgi:hypothetical protein